MSRKEIIHRNALTSLLLERGYNVYLPVFDEGIDLIIHRESDSETRLVQQKSRWGINRKYLGRNIWLAFPDRDHWYMLPHDDMLEWPEVAGYLATSSWKDKGAYHIANMPKRLAKRCARFCISIAP